MQNAVGSHSKFGRRAIYCLLVPAYCLLFNPTYAQEEKPRWLLGAGLTYDNYMNKPGVNLNVTYRVIGNFHIGPDFSALLNKEDKENGVTVLKKELEYNFNATQLFELNKVIAIYPLAGINFSKVTTHPVNSEPVKKVVTALNVGGGVELELKSFKLFFESKYVSQLDKYDFTLGALFRL
ncbi:MAG: porin family protein [Bacteroidetes bacterium]|nr:porin family protein [Bacteroidota bacterium]MBI3481921.1 porin family protein [Bacteroidota bacterium]